MSAPARPPRKPGRPRAVEASTTVCAWMPSGAHDRLLAQARRQDQSLSAYVRTLLLKIDSGFRY